MTLTWVLYAVAFSTLFSIIGFAGERLLGGYSWPLRKWWSLCLLFSWLAPLALAVMPHSETDRGAPPPRPAAVEPGQAAAPSIPSSIAIADRQPDDSDRSFGALFLVGWGAATALLLTRQSVMLARIVRRQRGRPRSDLDGIEVVETHELGPAVIGIFRPRILMPQWLEEMSGSIRRLALLHETEHVRARDTWRLLAGWLPCAVLPWNLPLWWQMRRLRSAIEVDCDRRVLRQGVLPREYGELLLVVGGRLAGSPSALVALFESMSQLERRLRFITMERPGHLSLRLATLAVVLLGGAVTLASAPLPDAAITIRPGKAATRSDSTRVKILFPESETKEKECLAGCSSEDQLRVLEGLGLARESCSALVRIMVARKDTPFETALVEESPDPRCNEAALAWARETRWEPQSERNPIHGVVRPFGAADTFPLSSTEPIVVHGWSEHFKDGGSPGSLLLSADPDFDFWSELPPPLSKAYDDWVIQEQRQAQAPAACVVGRSNDRFALRMLEGRDAASLLADTLEGSEIEDRIRELAPDLELYSVGALFDGGTCMLLLPDPTGTTGDAARGAEVDAADPRDGLPRCVEGCSIWARKEFFRERGLEDGACDVSALLLLAESGEVDDVEILRGEAEGACGRAMRDWALSTRWEAAPGEHDRWFTVGMRPPAGDEKPVGEPLFRTYVVPDPSKHVLLVHPDPDVTLEDLRVDSGSGLGPVVLVDEAHARSRTLCTVGRAADDRTVLRTDAVGPEVTYDPLVNGPDLHQIARLSRDLRPELQWLIGALLEESGSCFLLRPLDVPG